MDSSWNRFWDVLGMIVGGTIGLTIVAALVGGLSALFR